jgi:CubicO group peptidase (beta-lactamase class C family)
VSVTTRVAGLVALLSLWWSLPLAAAQDSQAHDYLAASLARAGAPAISAAVSVHGRMVFSGGVGNAELEGAAKQNGRTVHNIGSISKVETAAAVMQLVERGKVQLDAELQRYVPWFPRKPWPITLRQILTHTSGIRHYRDGELTARNANVLRHYDSFESATRFWRDDPLLFPPGTHFSYSSFAVNLLQAVIERVSGQRFEAYMQQHVWGPAGMVDSQFDVPARVVARRGHAYERNQLTGQLEEPLGEDLSYKYASGGMLGSDEDLCRFGHALNSGVLLRPETLEELYRLQLSAAVTRFGGPGAVAPSDVQALGFRVSRDPRGRVHAGHAGAVKGSVSQFYNWFRDDVVVAVYMNVDSEVVDLADVAEALGGMFGP